MSFKFELPEAIPIDSYHSLEQLSRSFQSLKDGLPELVKNSKDQYSRLQIRDRESRQVVVLIDTIDRKICVLDFAGASLEEFKGWERWSSRTANRQDMADDIEGGHGNGGKSFMVRGSRSASYMDSCANGRRTCMGFDNTDEEEKYKPGFTIIKGQKIRDIPEITPGRRLAEALQRFGVKLADLPPNCQRAFERRQAFTAAVVEGISEWYGSKRDQILKAASLIPSIVADHGQAAMTLDSCEVWFFIDGVQFGEQPLAPSLLVPLKGFENEIVVPVPSKLLDPQTEAEIETGCKETDSLTLRTSSKHLRLSNELKPKNVIRVWNSRNNVATWTLPSLGTGNPAESFIYGHVRLSTLNNEHLAGADRTDLADTPLTRALKKWIADEVLSLASRIQKMQGEEHRPEDRDRAQRTLEELRDLMREYLEPKDVVGEWSGVNKGGPGAGPGTQRLATGGGGARKLPITAIEFEQGIPSLSLAKGSTVPLFIRCFGHDEEGKKVPVVGVDLRLICSQPHLCEMNSEDELTAMEAGVGDIWVETPNGAIRSNKVSVDIFSAIGAKILLPPGPILQGQRIRIPVEFQTNSGPRIDALVQADVEAPGMASVGRYGYLTAKSIPGVATINVRFGPAITDIASAEFMVSDEHVPAKGAGLSGGNIPNILICGEAVPGLEHLPEEVRTHQGGEIYPTIIEEPQFPDIVWINTNSKESSRVRRTGGGATGIIRIGTKTYAQFIALKCFEILKRLRVRQEISENAITELEFQNKFAQAEVDCAAFIDAAFDISENILKGKEES